MISSESDDEKVNHPRHYTQHASKIECIELIEHLPANLANAIKYIWRCGLKTTETPLTDLKKARWYTERERDRCRLFELDGEDWYSGKTKTDVIWRSLARRVVEKEDNDATDPKLGLKQTILSQYLSALLELDSRFVFADLLLLLNHAITELESKA
jgi:hypothetical protein